VVAAVAVVDRCVAGAFEGVGVVAGGNVEVSIRAELDGTAVVADAVAAVAWDFEQHFLGCRVHPAAAQFEAREAVEELLGIAVVEVKALVFREFGVEGDPEQAVLASPWRVLFRLAKRGDLEVADFKNRAGGRPDAEDAAFALDHKKIPVRGDGEFHRIAETGGDDLGGGRGNHRRAHQEEKSQSSHGWMVGILRDRCNHAIRRPTADRRAKTSTDQNIPSCVPGFAACNG
jgi:hypothetical protein